MSELIDITMPIHPGMVIYPKNPEVSFKLTQEASASTNALTRMTLGTHTGTHIDAPRHVDVNGAGAAQISLDVMVGPAEIVDVSQVESVITAHDLPATSQERILLKTKNSAGDVEKFYPDFVALDESAATEVVKRGIKLIGLDALSIKKKGVRDKTHNILLDAGVIILEGIWLAGVAAGEYELLCLPMKVDLDGAPARVVLSKL